MGKHLISNGFVYEDLCSNMTTMLRHRLRHLELIGQARRWLLGVQQLRAQLSWGRPTSIALACITRGTPISAPPTATQEAACIEEGCPMKQSV